MYLADRRFDMLPSVLSERVCSLRSNVDRYAGKQDGSCLNVIFRRSVLQELKFPVSVLWTLDKSYNVVDTWLGRTVIRSSCEMEYEQAQQFLNGESVADNLGMQRQRPFLLV